MASMSIGAGNVILAPRLGAWGGYQVLWIITFAFFTKGFISYAATRYSLLSGENIMSCFFSIRPRGWINILTLILCVVILPTIIATFITLLGQTMVWITGTGSYIVWGIGLSLAVALVGIMGTFKLLEKIQLIFCLLLAVGAIIAIIVVNPPWLKIFLNLFNFRAIPRVPSWASAIDPELLTISVPLQLAAVYGTMCGTYLDFTAYIEWWRKKTDYKKKDLRFLGPLKIDIFLAFLIVSLFTLSFMVGGTIFLGKNKLLPTGMSLIKEQSRFYTIYHPAMKYIYQIAILVVIIGTLYTGMDGLPRMIRATLSPLSKKIKGMSFKKIQLLVVGYLLITSVPLVLLKISPILLITIYLFSAGVIGFCVFGWGALWANQRKLPREKKFNKGMLIMMVGVNIILTFFVASIFLFPG